MSSKKSKNIFIKNYKFILFLFILILGYVNNVDLNTICLISNDLGILNLIPINSFNYCNYKNNDFNDSHNESYNRNYNNKGYNKYNRNNNKNKNNISYFNDKYDSKHKYKIIYNVKENLSKDIDIQFCPSKNCFNLLNSTLSSANFEIKCAFYELNEENIIKTLLKESKEGVNISLIIDDKYLHEKSFLNLYNTSIKIYSDLDRGTKYNNYMHNKYCIIDKHILITGSMNPTYNGIFRNNNNLIRIDSKYLSSNYIEDFNQMSIYNLYGSNKISSLRYNNISLNYLNETYIISSYFCPPDRCANQIIKRLKNAKKSINFAAFSFTENSIEKELISLNNKGINISGVIEKRNSNGVSSIFKDTNLNIYLDHNKHNMHNKYFIIDNDYVITGSMNPSNNGNKYNDENILIIKNNKIANIYKKNYLKLI